MSLEHFELLDKEPIDKSIVGKDFLKFYHQQGAQINDPNQNIEFMSGEKVNYHQVGNSYLEIDISVRDPTAGFNITAEIRLGKNGFASCFTEATIGTTGGMEIEQVNFSGQVSNIMSSLTTKDGDLLPYFDNINDTDENTSLINYSLNDRLIISHSVAVNRGKIKRQLPLKHKFGFCKTFKKITKILGLHLTFKTADLQNITFISIANVIDVTIKNFYRHLPVLFSDSNTEVLFNESIKNKFTITYDSWYVERKLSTDCNELQVDIGSAQHVNSPQYFIGAFQTADRIATPNKNKIKKNFRLGQCEKIFL